MAKPVRSNWVDYLRSAITVLVVAHHSSLAYTTFAYFNNTTYINSTAPVVDRSRWIGMDIFENFNDIFFMSLMFLISGLFIFKNLRTKGTRKFLAGRWKRLGVPFIIAVSFIIPLAYLPSFYLANHQFNILLFIHDYITHQQWPVGPPWFIWILLLFNLVAVIVPPTFYISVSKSFAGLSQKPLLFFITAFIIVAISFIPISLWVGQYTWTGFGPFDFQVNRIFLYFVFFLFGACMGSGDWENDLFTNEKLLNKPWLFWAVICLACYSAITFLSFYGAYIVKAGKLSSTTGWLIFDVFFVASCIASSFTFLSFFRQKINNPSKLWSNLSANAFRIYLIHYVFVTWIQFSLLNILLPVIIKFSIVFVGALVASWLTINRLRKFKIVNQII